MSEGDNMNKEKAQQLTKKRKAITQKREIKTAIKTIKKHIKSAAKTGRNYCEFETEGFEITENIKSVAKYFYDLGYFIEAISKYSYITHDFYIIWRINWEEENEEK